MEYNIIGKITFDVDFDVEADSEEEALEKAKELLNDYYRLEVRGAYHDEDAVEIELDAVETEYEEDGEE